MTFFDDPFPDIVLDQQYYLRELKEEDSEAFYQMFNDARILPYIPDDFIFPTIEHARQEIRFLRSLFHERRSIQWAIARRDDDRFIGACGYNSWHHLHNRLELIYKIHPDYWRRGIMRRALIHIRQFAFQVMGAHRIEAYTTPDNTASYRLLESMGFKLDGVLRRYRFYKGKMIDVKLYASLCGDKINQHPLHKQLRQTS